MEETASLVAGVLRDLGLEVTEGVAGSGVKAVLRSSRHDRAVLLRADMDGLPVSEATGLPFASEISGRMHACGHDLHTACVVGAASLLAECRDALDTDVVFVFQPAEEGPGGAAPMIEAGVMDDPPVGAAFMFHCDPSLRVGTIGVHQGAVCANCDDFTIEVVGRSGHGSAPHRGADAIVAAGQLLVALQSVVSRRVDPLEPAVVSVGTIHGGYNSNVIADRITLTGTLRSLSDEVRQTLRDELNDILQGVAMSAHVECRLSLEPGYPGFSNDPIAATVATAVAGKLIGPDRILALKAPSMGAEDFAYFARRVPAAALQLGVAAPEEGFGGELHSSTFNPDERAIAVGSSVLAAVALAYWSERSLF